MARQRGWKIILRIEDLDGPRIKRGADQQAIDDLAWLGIDWDEGPHYQSERRSDYERALESLVATKRGYACSCSRREIDLAASAPHAEDGAAVYPGTCRGKYASLKAARDAAGREPAVRFDVGDAIVEFDDEFCGHQRFEMSRLGDFVIQKADCTPAYQLAVVVDDAAMNVTQIVRGDDLLDSTPRQILLYRALGWTHCIPTYFHLPLVVGPDGRRLAKRHGDTRLASYRDHGAAPTDVLRLMARWLAIDADQPITTASDLLPHFRLERLSREQIVFDASRGLD
jgi:glutamyl-tRNA synthetase